MEAYIMSAFICDVGNPSASGYRMLLDNGEIKMIFTQPEWKEGLKYFRKLYQEGLLDPQSFTQAKINSWR